MAEFRGPSKFDILAKSRPHLPNRTLSLYVRAVKKGKKAKIGQITQPANQPNACMAHHILCVLCCVWMDGWMDGWMGVGDKDTRICAVGAWLYLVTSRACALKWRTFILSGRNIPGGDWGETRTSLRLDPWDEPLGG